MIPIFTIHPTGDLFAVRSIGLDPDPDARPEPPPPYLALQGNVATWLYLALAGHKFGSSPLLASPDLARHARALIARRLCFRADWMTAHLVTLQVGPFIQPWLGLLKVGPNGETIKEHADYHRRIKL